MVCDDCERLNGELVELKTTMKMNKLRVEALLDLLAKEGVMTRDDFEKKFSELCEGDGA